MWTVTQMARQAGLSRTTLLYYESIGLLRPARSGSGSYRRYTATDRARLDQIVFYKAAGLKLADIKAILAEDGGGAAARNARNSSNRNLASILERRLRELQAEIDSRRSQQRVILGLLRNKNSLGRYKVISKEKWVSIMQAAGFTEPEMQRWHVEFEHAAPAEHQEFLEFLHIPADEIGRIREWSRAGKHGPGKQN